MGGALSSGQSQIHHGRFEKVIYKVAEAISDDGDLRRLGVELGLRHSVILRAITKNWEYGPRSIDGNIVMLRKWANTIKRPDSLVPTLKGALVRAGLAEIAETCIPSSGEHAPSQVNQHNQRGSTLHNEEGGNPALQSHYSRSQSASVPETRPGEHAPSQVNQHNQRGSTLHSEEGGTPALQRRYLRSQSASVSETVPGGSAKIQSNPRSQSASALEKKEGGNRKTQSQTGSQSASPLENEPGAPEKMPADIHKLREKLKTRYLRKYGKIKTSPVDPNSCAWLQKIFVSLLLILKSSVSMNANDEQMEIDGLYKLITTKSQKGFVTRLAFLGNVGAGKSTLFYKIALDWAMGKCLQDINLLFLESFQDMEKDKSFGNIVMNHFKDMTEITGDRIDQYMQTNQRKVAILITDVNEKKMDLTVPDVENAVVSIVRGDRLVDTPVLITTLPYIVDLIKSDDNIHELYTLIQVKGFTKNGTREYITQFFRDDTDCADSLVHFVKSNKLVSEYLAPIPMFCSMLCHIWQNPSRREELKNSGTFSHLLKEICFSLGEQYFSKHRQRDSRYESHMRKVEDTIRAIGKVAFEGFEQNQQAFNEVVMEPFMKDVLIACEIGILCREKRLAPREIRIKHTKQYIEEYNFPHKLWHEYVAGSYLASLFAIDRSKFDIILTERVFKDYKKFTYVLFFTAAYGGEVGNAVMKALCQKVHDIRFIMEVAFECQDIGALDPVRKLLTHKRTIVPDHSTTHTSSATVFALETYGKELIEEVKHTSTKSPSDATRTYSDARTVQYTKALFDMPNLRFLQLANTDLENEFFFTTMAAKAKKSQIMTLKHEGGRLDQASSSHYSEAITSMPHLQHLEMCDVELSSDDFYPKMADGASKSRIMTLKQEGGSLSPAASAKYAQAIVSMPNLQTLELSDVELNDEFYPQLAVGASKSRIVTLKHEGGKLGKDASKQYAKAILTMPNLQHLEMCNVKLSDDFYQPTRATKASNTKIKKLKHVGGTLGPDASSHYAKGLSSMPTLQSLELENVKLHDDFYKKASTEAFKSNVEVLRHTDAELGSVASSYYGQGLFSMPNLRSLELDRVKLSPEFFSTMCAKTSTSEITSLRHVDGDLTPTSSYNYAKGLFSMPHLRSLDLIRMKLTDDFFKSMSSEASNSKIEKLRHTDADLSHDASPHYARGLCSMPKLQSLELHNVKLKDEFSASMTAGAPRSKIQTLVMKMCTVNRRILRAILSLPQLQSFSLVGDIHLPANIDERKTLTLGTSSVKDLSLDCRSVAGLWKLGLHTSCQRVNKLTLYFYDEDLDSSDTITTACSPFLFLTELHIHWQRAFDPVEFYNALRTSCPRLTKLSLTRIKMYNDKATEIIQSLTTLPNLTIVEMDSCWTDGYLDPIIAQVNNESRLTVTVVHGPEETPEVLVYV